MISNNCVIGRLPPGGSCPHCGLMRGSFLYEKQFSIAKAVPSAKSNFLSQKQFLPRKAIFQPKRSFIPLVSYLKKTSYVPHSSKALLCPPSRRSCLWTAALKKFYLVFRQASSQLRKQRSRKRHFLRTHILHPLRRVYENHRSVARIKRKRIRQLV